MVLGKVQTSKILQSIGYDACYVQTSYYNHNPSIFEKSQKLLLFEKWLEIDHNMNDHYVYLK